MEIPYTVNCSILLTHLDLPERLRVAREAGFAGVELWWPFPVAVPDDDDVDSLVRAVADSGIRLTGLNFFAGDMPAGDRGLISWPARTQELRDNLDVVTDIGERTGCRRFNALYGNRIPGMDPAEQDALAVENLALAARAVERIGGTVLVEPVSGMPSYPLKTSSDVVTVLDRVETEAGATPIGLLLDVYHLAVNGADVSRDIMQYIDRVAHVQIADAPGRGAPGAGALPLDRWISELRQAGYEGPIGLEYQSDDPDPFSWLPVADRSAPSSTTTPGKGSA